MSFLTKPRDLIRGISLMREANRRGVEIDDLPAEVLSAKIGPRVDPTRWGLVPDAEVSDEPLANPAVAAAKVAAGSGDWEHVAHLVAATRGDWNRRFSVVRALGELAASDDEWLTTWRRARPGDGDAAAVHAESLVMLAWEIRGSAAASQTTRQQFDGFHRVIGQAEEAAKMAAALLPDDPTPLVTWITVARALGYDHEQFTAVWEQLDARDPHHRAAHVQALQYWCAKWSGSDELMCEFALRAAMKSPSLAHLPLLAAAELERSTPDVWTSDFARNAVDRMLVAIDGLGADTKPLLDARGYAAYVLVANKRYNEAVEQLRLIGPHALCAPWEDYQSPKLAFLQFRAKTCKKAKR
jgi:hypothetical protein